MCVVKKHELWNALPLPTQHTLCVARLQPHTRLINHLERQHLVRLELSSQSGVSRNSSAVTALWKRFRSLKYSEGCNGDAKVKSSGHVEYWLEHACACGDTHTHTHTHTHKHVCIQIHTVPSLIKSHAHTQAHRYTNTYMLCWCLISRKEETSCLLILQWLSEIYQLNHLPPA